MPTGSASRGGNATSCRANQVRREKREACATTTATDAKSVAPKQTDYKSDLRQLADQIALFDQVLWAARGVEELRGADVDAHIVIERGKDFLHLDRAVLGILGVLRCRADHLAQPHAAAGEEGRAQLPPTV